MLVKDYPKRDSLLGKGAKGQVPAHWKTKEFHK